MITPQEYIEQLTDEELKLLLQSIINDYSMLDVLTDYYNTCNK